jgi:transcriptional regulator with XRE-family HTH domain
MDTSSTPIMDRSELADFLRRRREALQPEDVGLPKGTRRRTRGLRREEVAALCGMSVDYISRLEQERGPQPSQQMLAAIAQGLRLTIAERDHLFRLAGRGMPDDKICSNHVSPALLRVLDRLDDTPAQIVTQLGEVLVQNRFASALLGDRSGLTGFDRSLFYRWFTDPESRRIYPERNHVGHSRIFVSQLRAAFAQSGHNSPIRTMVQRLMGESAEFAGLWNLHEVGIQFEHQKTIVHPELGEIHVHCQTLLAVDSTQRLLVYTAVPGSVSYEKLRRLGEILPGMNELRAAAD